MRSRLILLPLAVLMACGGSSDSTSPTPTGGGGGGGGGGGTTPTVTTAVDMKSNAFTPKAIKVSPSATVTWTNTDEGTLHNVTFDGGTITGSGNFSTGTKSLAMPATPGTYTYKCTFHAGMTGSVQVQ